MTGRFGSGRLGVNLQVGKGGLPPAYSRLVSDMLYLACRSLSDKSSSNENDKLKHIGHWLVAA
jgi:hypothetical protein